ncbi:MAG: type II toxin-antitoxin system RatA family toxin [Gammaproteobacteria bacterium]|nr:MAG: type II toxin-antitoxin system RatA family toxin [Gammaproteobacteria bacterium]
MPIVNKSALVPYSPQCMFDIVNDVNAYPEFLPWCRAAEILEQDEDELTARLLLAKGSIKKSFITKNRIQPGKMIEIRLVEGPFKHLQGFWRFEPLGEDGCKISVDMEFEFAGKLLSMTVGPVFNQIANSLLDAFIERARQIYG